MGTKITNINNQYLSSNVPTYDLELDYGKRIISNNYIDASTGNELDSKKYMHLIRLYKSGSLQICLIVFSSTNTLITSWNNLYSFITSTSIASTGEYIYCRGTGSYFVSSSVGWRPIIRMSVISGSSDRRFCFYYSSSRTSSATSIAYFTSSSGVTISDKIIVY